MTEKEILRRVATAARVAAPAIPGPGGWVLGVIAEALGFAADLAAAGLNPITEIERIRAAHPQLAAVERGWEAELRRKFGPKPDLYEG